MTVNIIKFIRDLDLNYFSSTTISRLAQWSIFQYRFVTASGMFFDRLPNSASELSSETLALFDEGLLHSHVRRRI
jgi:hypothetical protein